MTSAFLYKLNIHLRMALLGAGEMAQWLRAQASLCRSHGFNSQDPHGGSEPSLRGYAALFRYVVVYAAE